MSRVHHYHPEQQQNPKYNQPSINKTEIFRVPLLSIYISAEHTKHCCIIYIYITKCFIPHIQSTPPPCPTIQNTFSPMLHWVRRVNHKGHTSLSEDKFMFLLCNM